MLVAFKHHVFKQMGEPAALIRVILGTDVIPNLDRNGRTGMILDGVDLQTVRQRCVLHSNGEIFICGAIEGSRPDAIGTKASVINNALRKIGGMLVSGVFIYDLRLQYWSACARRIQIFNLRSEPDWRPLIALLLRSRAETGPDWARTSDPALIKRML